MKVAVVGCGAVGSFYGAKLCRAGQEVHFLLRSDYEVVRRKGVAIQSRDGDFHVHPICARHPKEIGVTDMVLIGLKTTANDRLPELIPPLVSPSTAVVTLQNGLGNEEQLAKIVAPEKILGGLCFVCLNRAEPGVIHHIDHGAVVLGEFRRSPQPRTHQIAAMFREFPAASLKIWPRRTGKNWLGTSPSTALVLPAPPERKPFSPVKFNLGLLSVLVSRPTNSWPILIGNNSFANSSAKLSLPLAPLDLS